MRILVTGANGFIGQHIVPLMKGMGEVFSCASKTCNLLDAKSVTEMMREIAPTHCVHLAWYTKGDYAESKDNINWLEAGQHLIREFYSNGGERFVGVGTCFEYALAEHGRLDENSAILPHTLYGKCKLALGSYLKTLATRLHVSWAWCRPFFITGPGESSRRLVPAACIALLHNEAFYSKSYYRILDYMDVRDVARAISQVLRSNYQGCVNIASGNGQTVGELLTILSRLASRKNCIKHEGIPSGEMNIIANVAVLKNIIKFYPQYSLQETLVACLEDVRRRTHECR